MMPLYSELQLIIILSLMSLSKNYHQHLPLPEHFHRPSWNFIRIQGVDDHPVSINMFLASFYSPRYDGLNHQFVLACWIFFSLPLSETQAAK